MIKVKYFSSFLFLFSCSGAPTINLDLGYLTLFKEGLSSRKIEIDESFKSNMEFSFVKIAQGRKQAIFVLSSSANGIETWVGSNSEIIKTFRGLIIETIGLDQNFRFEQQLIDEVFYNYLKSDFQVTASLSNPLLVGTAMEYIYMGQSSSDSCSKLINYRRSFKALNASFLDYICLNKINEVQYSIQRLNPLGKDIIMEFHYLY